MRELQKHGHSISIICALETDSEKSSYYSEEDGFRIVRVKIGANKKANIVKKGITTVTEPYRYINAIKKYYGSIKFDLVIYPTPPITQVRVVEYIKKRDGAKSYLLLRDIFPQNAVDIGMMTKSGLKGVLYKHFRKVEKKLYGISDFIGCMSEANVRYLIEHNPEIDPGKVEVCANSVEVIDNSVDGEAKASIRKKYGISSEKTAFIYGGNLGKPQDIPFVIGCMKECAKTEGAFFIIVGDGTEYGKLENYIKTSGQANIKLLRKLPREDYNTLVAACDVGLIFLDHRFTIPNFPSRLLSYMQAKIPVLACTDPNTDVGQVITSGGFGWWCESNDVSAFSSLVSEILQKGQIIDKEREFQYLKDNFAVETAYKTIASHFNS